MPDMLRHFIVAHLVNVYGKLQEENRLVRILDVACGFGEQLHILKTNRVGAGTRLAYTGLDVDPRKRARAVELNPSIDYRLGDITTSFWSMVDRRYDVVISTETLEHLRKEDGQKFLENCMSVVAPGGHMILTCPNPNLHRDNPWHLYEWPREELAAFITAHKTWEVVDQFDIKIPSRDIKKVVNLPAKTGMRVPNELLRGAIAGVAPGTVMIYVLTHNGGLIDNA